MEFDGAEAEEVPVEDIEQEAAAEEQHGMEEIAEDYPMDANLRRQLGDITEKYSSLEARHNELRDVGIKEAERSYARLKKLAAENTATADKLIAELKAELAAQTALAKKAEAAEAKIPALQTKVAELSTSLTDARSEIKTLNTKLTAARNTEANIKAPGSALKPNAAGNRGVSSEVVQAAQAKEDLYGDLTGLIIRGMKHVDDEEVFDCLQTGRNGTLHFKLALSSPDAADNYDDVQYTYLPQLNPDRDSELMAVLPDFLVEEITFPRPHASKFYTRVIKSLTERVE
ncbi:Monopolin complex subunit pcs1 [Emericellopsis cladophorae]|uniref:Monopolin complex subunit pcs1 n=1 Tax=Emericellopsis cladophorae TaxID=2686198 RepID=A0A9P9Y0L4_9HYPO|nr:Monopolin complex subunit pcs1 [Emericellopsis cladophorae]KAI6781378.1 Monopolin complex subunit pcs1 [Emericellopsis cladophorae]